jgi:hypothetical protein
MPYAQLKNPLKPPRTNLESGINLKVAYQALMTGYQRTHGSSVSRRPERRGPDQKGERK